MKYLDYAGLQQYDLLIKQYIQDNIPDSSQAADVATALKNAANPNSNIKIAVCTQAEYNALQNPESNVLYIISDETSEVVNVEANPTLDGTESVLGSIKIGGVKYAIPSGGGGSSGTKYLHNLTLLINYTTYDGRILVQIPTNDNTPFTKQMLIDFLNNNSLTSVLQSYKATGYYERHQVNSIFYKSSIDTLEYVYDLNTWTSFNPNQIFDIIIEL